MRLKRESDVLVVGAGPVGLFTALCLAERGVGVQVIDKEWRGSVHSYALALHPESLRLLAEHGVAEDDLGRCHRIERIAFYDGEKPASIIDFAKLDSPYPYVLVVPQSSVEHAVEKQLEHRKVRVFWNHQAMNMEQTKDAVAARVARMEKFSTGYPIAHTEWMVTKETDTRHGFVVGADGYQSFVRKQFDVDFENVGKAEAFCVFEFPCEIPFEREARVVFHEGTTNVIWPLGEGRGRWSFQVDPSDPPAPKIETLKKMIAERAPWFDGNIEEITWATTAMFERRLVNRFGTDRIWLAGDAAHGAGPVGAQSMNVGLREAHDLVGCLTEGMRTSSAGAALESYGSERQDEWRRLLCMGSAVEADSAASDWTRGQADRILPCIPASGKDLRLLLGQIGLRLP